jgi:uncharacterized protein YndB with AHSA1/START domain
MTLRPAANRTLSKSVRLAAPPDKVWDLITAVASIPDWYDTWDLVEHAADDERLEVGTSFRLIRHRLGRVDTALCRVTSLQPPARLCWVQSSPHRPAMSVEFHLVADATGTRVQHTRTWTGGVDPSH